MVEKPEFLLAQAHCLEKHDSPQGEESIEGRHPHSTVEKIHRYITTSPLLWNANYEQSKAVQLHWWWGEME